MPHPTDKKDRFLKGKNKGIRRATGLLANMHTPDPETRTKCLERTAKLSRHTSKLCSCAMCGNPRKFFDEKTMQEKKFNESKIDE